MLKNMSHVPRFMALADFFNSLLKNRLL